MFSEKTPEPPKTKSPSEKISTEALTSCCGESGDRGDCSRSCVNWNWVLVQSCGIAEAGRERERGTPPPPRSRLSDLLGGTQHWKTISTQPAGHKKGPGVFFLSSLLHNIPAAAMSSLWTFAERKRCRQKTTKTHPLHLGMDLEAPPPYFLCLPRSPPERFPSEKIRCARGEENKKNQRARLFYFFSWKNSSIGDG